MRVREEALPGLQCKHKRKISEKIVESKYETAKSWFKHYTQ